MATTTRILDADVNGIVYTANASDALEALDTCHSGATAPTDEVANGKFWLDTSTTPSVLKIYDNAGWNIVYSGRGDLTVAGTVNATALTGDGTGITGVATTAQGALADTAVQPADNISTLTNDTGFYASGSNPTFGAVTATSYAGDGSNLTGVGGIAEVVTSGTASGASQIVFSGLSFATYNYKLLLSDMRPSATEYLYINFSTDNFANECAVQHYTSGSGGIASNTSTINKDFIFHTSEQSAATAVTYSGINCELNFMDNKSPSYNYVSIWGHGVVGADTSAYSYETRGGLSYNGVTNPVTHMRIVASGLSKTISGRYTLYRSVRA